MENMRTVIFRSYIKAIMFLNCITLKIKNLGKEIKVLSADFTILCTCNFS